MLRFAEKKEFEDVVKGCWWIIFRQDSGINEIGIRGGLGDFLFWASVGTGSSFLTENDFSAAELACLVRSKRSLRMNR